MNILCPTSYTPTHEYESQLSKISGSIDSLLPLILRIDNFKPIEEIIGSHLVDVDEKINRTISDISLELSKMEIVNCLDIKVDSKRHFALSTSLLESGMFVTGIGLTFFAGMPIAGAMLLICSQVFSKINDVLGRKSLEREMRESVLRGYLYSSRIVEKDVNEVMDVYDLIGDGLVLSIPTDDKIDGAHRLSTSSSSNGSASKEISKEILVEQLKGKAIKLSACSKKHLSFDNLKTVTTVEI